MGSISKLNDSEYSDSVTCQIYSDVTYETADHDSAQFNTNSLLNCSTIDQFFFCCSKSESVRFGVFKILCVLIVFLQGCSADPLVRKAAVAGFFYPADSDTLRAAVKEYMNRDVPDTLTPLVGIIAPHAGYVYSGKTAGYAYAALAKNRKGITTVYLIGPAHYVPVSGIALYDGTAWETPQGKIMIDRKKIQELSKKSTVFKIENSAFAREHSLETQIPFLQAISSSFQIIPLLVSDMSMQTLEKTANLLSEYIDFRNSVIVVSTDMSHYHPRDNANKMDEKTMKLIENLDYPELMQKSRKRECELCGITGVALACAIFKKRRAQVFRLHYSDSSESSGDRAKVVGYCAFAFRDTIIKERNMYTEQEKKELLKLARESIESRFSKKTPVVPDNPKYQEMRAVFVTLKKKGELRGCIGQLQAYASLSESILSMAQSAAFQDPRFSPVTEKELSDIQVEISVLSPTEPVKSADDIVMKKHGVILKKMFNRSVFLPQVAEETGWDKETFLEHLAMKAGLPSSAWKDASYEVFTVDKFTDGNE